MCSVFPLSVPYSLLPAACVPVFPIISRKSSYIIQIFSCTLHTSPSGIGYVGFQTIYKCEQRHRGTVVAIEKSQRKGWAFQWLLAAFGAGYVHPVMTDCFSSPISTRFGIKRLSSGNCYTETNEDLSQTRNPFKKSRNSCSYFPSTHEADHSSTVAVAGIESVGSLATTRAGDQRGPSPAANHLFNDENHMESYRRSIRSEFQCLLNQKDADIALLSSRISHQDILLAQSQAAKAVTEEENRILKRAVTIQDGRQKEQSHLNQQLQSLLTQAADHVANVERINAELRRKVDSERDHLNYPRSEFGSRFPDVF